MGYSFGNFEVNALQQLTITPANLQKETTTLIGDNKHIAVATYNVLNLGPNSTDDAKRATIASHVVTNLGQPDIIALQEILDNSGTDDDGTTAADITLQRLVDAIMNAGGFSYDYFDVAPVDGSSGGIPGGNIRNAFLYNPARVSLIDYESLTPAVLATYGVTNTNAFADTRDPLKATFKFRGKEFTVINNHLTSRFGSTPIFGGPQPFVQASETAREAQAAALNEVVQSIVDAKKYMAANASKAPRVLVLGDFNTFQFTNDLTDILPGTGEDQILWNMVSTLVDDNVYSFNFEGNSETFDHIFVSEPLNAVAEYDIVHVNVDYPRVDANVASDHEPSIVRLKLKN
jgi:predicted extracellular nuclease